MHVCEMQPSHTRILYCAANGGSVGEASVKLILDLGA